MSTLSGGSQRKRCFDGRQERFAFGGRVCVFVCQTERGRQSVGVVEMTPASLPFGAIL